MKRFFVGLVVLALSVLGTLGAQKFSSLPIGYNLDGYISRILVEIGSRENGKWTQEQFEYSRNSDGALEAFAEQKLREVAGRFTPVSGAEQFAYMWDIAAYTDGIGGLLPTYSGVAAPTHIAGAPPPDEYVKLYETGFHLIQGNGKWEVPEEVFGKVRFQFGAAISYYIPEVWNLKVDVSDSTGKVARLAARERIQDEGNPCALPVILFGLNDSLAVIPNEIATAQSSWWERAEITLYTKAESVTFLVNRTAQDGTAIRWSSPPPSFFVPPPPKIASLTRRGATTEITVFTDGSVSVHLEFSETLGGSWYSIPKYLQPLSMQTGSTKFSHTIEADRCFYRVRLAEPQLQR